MSLRTLFVDFNSFFASVEQQERPELRGRPVAVVPMLADTTCCIAASYEAKAFQVKTGTKVREARLRCPGIHLIEARPQLYVDYHHRLVDIIESCIHVEKVLSIDEMACHLTGPLREEARATELALRIKQTIYDRGYPALRCSIGIAPNTFLAKTASDMQKPDGLTILRETDLPHALHSLTLRDLCGIGENMELRLRRKGILTVAQLCAASKETLRAVWGGIEGERFYDRLRGREVYEPPTNRTTVSHSHVLAPDERTHPRAAAVLNRLLQKAAMRLRKLHHMAGRMGVSVKYTDGSRWNNEMRFRETDDTLQLLRILDRLWSRREQSATPMAVGVVLFELVPREGTTLPLFEKPAVSDSLNRAIDTLNKRYGKNTVYFGGAHHALGSAPMRIAFNRIPDPFTEGDALPAFVPPSARDKK
jgi:DNA polymerase-4